jgi:uncharacterized protein YciI
VKYFAAIQSALDADKTATARQAHIDYLERMVAAGKIHLKGRFPDGSGGLTIYRAATLDEARALAENDPYVLSGGRRLDVREWDMKPKPE